MYFPSSGRHHDVERGKSLSFNEPNKSSFFETIDSSPSLIIFSREWKAAACSFNCFFLSRFSFRADCHAFYLFSSGTRHARPLRNLKHSAIENDLSQRCTPSIAPFFSLSPFLLLSSLPSLPPPFLTLFEIITASRYCSPLSISRRYRDIRLFALRTTRIVGNKSALFFKSTFFSPRAPHFRYTNTNIGILCSETWPRRKRYSFAEKFCKVSPRVFPSRLRRIHSYRERSRNRTVPSVIRSRDR